LDIFVVGFPPAAAQAHAAVIVDLTQVKILRVVANG